MSQVNFSKCIRELTQVKEGSDMLGIKPVLTGGTLPFSSFLLRPLSQNRFFFFLNVHYEKFQAHS